MNRVIQEVEESKVKECLKCDANSLIKVFLFSSSLPPPLSSSFLFLVQNLSR